MAQIIQLNKRPKPISVEIYQKIVMPISENPKSNYEINIVLGNNEKHTRRAIAIIEDDTVLDPYHVYMVLKFIFKTSDRLIDISDITPARPNLRLGRTNKFGSDKQKLN